MSAQGETESGWSSGTDKRMGNDGGGGTTGQF